MTNLAGDLRTPDSSAVVTGTIALTATRQRAAGSKTLVKITYPITVTASTYSEADIPGGKYDVQELLESDGIWGAERPYKIVVPDTGTWTLSALREMYEGPPDPDPELFLTRSAAEDTYVRLEDYFPGDGDPLALYKQLARNPEMLVSGAVTRNADGIVTSAPVRWPDGSVGTFAVTSLGTFGVDSYYITYGSPVTATYAQPAITRDSNGVPTNVPDITLTGLAPDTTAPTVPTSLAASAIGATTAHIAWSASSDGGSGVGAYKVRDAGVLIATVSTLYADLTGLAAGASHSITVSAVDVVGNESAQSSAVVFTTVALGFSDNFATPEGSAVGRVSPGGAKTLQVLKAGATVATPTITATGRLQFPDANGTVLAVYDANTNNGTFSCLLAYIDTDKAPIIGLKAVDYNNRINLGRVSSSVKNWNLSKTVAGTTTTIFETAVPINSGDIISAVWAGTTLTLSINGTQVYTGTITEFATATLFGAGVLSASNEGLLDDFAFAAA